MKCFGFILLILVMVGLPLLLFTDKLGLAEFTAVGTFWLVSIFLIILGPETITEVTLWKASIKRNVQKAEEIKEEAEKILEKLRSVTKLNVEIAFITASSSSLAMGGSVGKTKVEQNLEQLMDFAVPNKNEQDRWWESMQNLFPERVKKPSGDQ